MLKNWATTASGPERWRHREPGRRRRARRDRRGREAPFDGRASSRIIASRIAPRRRAARAHRQPTGRPMRQFLDFLPIIVFFVAYYVTDRDLLLATAILIGAQTVQMGVLYALHRQLDKQMKMQFWVVLVLGGLTLALNDATFIQWKPTLVNWLLACAVGGSQFLGERNLIERVLGHQLELPRPVWRTLGWGWAFAFFLAGALNLVVAYNFSEAFWVNYKLFGGLGLTLLYTIVTIVYLVRGGWLSEDEDADAAAKSEQGPS
jgi:intracellular septation protein